MDVTTSPQEGSRPPASSRSGLLPTLVVNIALPLVLYYAFRVLGLPQWQALVYSSAPPVLRVGWIAVRHRRVDGFDLFLLAMFALSAGLSMVGGSPRVLLFKDVAMPLVLGSWLLGTHLAARPFAFTLAQRSRSAAVAERVEDHWRHSPVFRRALRNLTTLWGGLQLVDAVVHTTLVLTLPVDAVPLVGRCASWGLLGLTVLCTVGAARRFRAWHGRALFGKDPDRGTGPLHETGTETGRAASTGTATDTDCRAPSLGATR